MNRETTFIQKILPATIFVVLMFAFASAAQAQIYPHFDCAEPLVTDAAGNVTQYRAWFGFENKSSGAVIINEGPNNFFSPNPNGQFSDQQTVQFPVGYFKKTFSITVTVTDTLKLVYWFVQNRPAQTSLNPACDNGTTSMTYQGRLSAAGAAANQPHDFEFRFFNSSADSEVLAHAYSTNVPVTNGVFTAQIDLGSVFARNAVEGKWMQIGVRRTGTTDAYEQLAPRQQLTAAPFAVNARNVSGGFVQIPVNTANTDNSPHKCNDATRGQMFLQSGTSSYRLFICTNDGWKFAALQ